MSINSGALRKAGPFSGNGSQTSFPFTFKVFKNTDLYVVLTDASGAETVQTLTSQYTVTLNSNQDSSPGGSVVMLTAPASGYLLTLGSQVPQTQGLTLTNTGGFYPTVLNDEFDKVTILIQQLNEQVSRAVKVGFSSSITPDTLLQYVTVLYNNIAALQAVAADLTNINTVAGNTTNINTVAGNTTNINTVAANSTAVTTNATNITAITTNATNITAIQNASTNASAAATSATAAAGSATSALGYLNSFKGQYYGALSSDPTLDPLGNAPTAGDLYFNTTTNLMRTYTGSAWTDTGAATPVTITTQRFSGNGSTTVFTLSVPPAFQNACEVYISGVAQVPGVDYTVSSTTLTFTTAPVSGTNNIFVRSVSALAAGVPNDGSVTPAKLSTGGPSWDASGNLKPTGSLQQLRVAVAASAIDLSTGNYFSKTISGTTTFTVSNVPTTGTAASFILDLTNGGSATVNWWSGVKWAGGTAPTLTSAGRDALGFFTHDGGTTWTGLVLGKDVK